MFPSQARLTFSLHFRNQLVAYAKLPSHFDIPTRTVNQAFWYQHGVGNLRQNGQTRANC